MEDSAEKRDERSEPERPSVLADLKSKEEVERIHEKMDELGIRSMGAYLRKMALDGYCIRLDLQDVKALVSLLRICKNGWRRSGRT